MALTIVLVTQTQIADRYVRVLKVTWDSSYATGGEAITPADMGFSDLAADLTVIDGGSVGAATISEMHKIRVVIAPSLLTEGKIYQKAQRLGMYK